ncbi:MAG: hypothetical protein MZV65_39945 [Chromatiales bacterium]|nr:hypothetical protein [Chromatiales bacterium]
MAKGSKPWSKRTQARPPTRPSVAPLQAQIDQEQRREAAPAVLVAGIGGIGSAASVAQRGAGQQVRGRGLVLGQAGRHDRAGHFGEADFRLAGTVAHQMRVFLGDRGAHPQLRRLQHVAEVLPWRLNIPGRSDWRGMTSLPATLARTSSWAMRSSVRSSSASVREICSARFWAAVGSRSRSWYWSA